jgi:DNA ligase (NAD+)
VLDEAGFRVLLEQGPEAAQEVALPAGDETAEDETGDTDG